MINDIFCLALGLSLLLSSCTKKPKIISLPSEGQETSVGTTGIFEESNSNQEVINREVTPSTSNMHSVEVLEVLPTDKYVYLKVEEGNDQYWVATGKRAINVGEKYFFSGGLLKTNFESKEYNRVFEKVYLVSKLILTGEKDDIAVSTRTWPVAKGVQQGKIKSMDKEGSIKIADLVKNPKQYEGKNIQLTGECVKLNHNIMGRNWIHLQDGSDDQFDLVITSDVTIPKGHIVTMSGTVSIDKDFGAGYRYDIIVENGKIVK